MKKIKAHIKTFPKFTFVMVFIVWPAFAIYFGYTEESFMKGLAMLLLPFLLIALWTWIIEYWLDLKD